MDGSKAVITNLECLEIPPFAEMLQGYGKYYPYDLTFENAMRNPIVILHSSGSTGRPETVIPLIDYLLAGRNPQAHRHDSRHVCNNRQ